MMIAYFTRSRLIFIINRVKLQFNVFKDINLMVAIKFLVML